MGRSKLICAAGVFVLLAGCATTGQNNANLQLQQMHERINYLEGELQNKNKEISRLETELYQKGVNQNLEIKKEDNLAVETSSGENEPISKKNVQIALKNAGFYKGPVDGKTGPQTKRAVKEFQKANGLKADGTIGKKTWLKLREYLAK